MYCLERKLNLIMDVWHYVLFTPYIFLYFLRGACIHPEPPTFSPFTNVQLYSALSSTSSKYYILLPQSDLLRLSLAELPGGHTPGYNVCYDTP